jgi:V8-like Glu-specific endopeptidase/PKD repeat protein
MGGYASSLSGTLNDWERSISAGIDYGGQSMTDERGPRLSRRQYLQAPDVLRTVLVVTVTLVVLLSVPLASVGATLDTSMASVGHSQAADASNDSLANDGPTFSVLSSGVAVTDQDGVNSSNATAETPSPSNQTYVKPVITDAEKRNLSYVERIQYNDYLTVNSSLRDLPVAKPDYNLTRLANGSVQFDERSAPNSTNLVQYIPGQNKTVTIDVDSSSEKASLSRKVAPPNSGMFGTNGSVGGVPGAHPEKVIGGDGREQVSDTTAYPYSSVTYLEQTYPNGDSYTCSGAMIGPDVVLTAAHCVYDQESDNFAESVTVYPGADGTGFFGGVTAPFGKASVTSISTYKGWTDYDSDKTQRWDFAVLTLDKSIGDQSGWFGYATRDKNNSFYTAPNLEVSGYPGDKPKATQWNMSGNHADRATKSFHYYYFDTAAGMSGGPVWVEDWGGSGENWIQTVHAYAGYGINFGVRINDVKFEALGSPTNPDLNDNPDLVDDGTELAGFGPSPTTHGEDFNVHSDIRNIGTIGTGCFEVSFYASSNDDISTSDHRIGSDTICGLSPFSSGNADWSGSFPSDIPAGEYYVGWIIDEADGTPELREDNNKAVITREKVEVNAKPTASFTYSPSHPEAGTSVTLDGSASTDDDPLDYDWDLDGDGTVEASGQSISRSFGSDQQVTLTVTDPQGFSDSVTETIDVNQPPNVEFSYSPTNPGEGNTVTLDASASDDPDGSIESYAWDTDNDGTSDEFGKSVDVRLYDDTAVTLLVADDDSATSSTSKSIEVDLEPTVDFSYSPSSPKVGETVTFDASGSNDPEGSISSYEWDFNNDGGTDATGQTVSHTFSSSGDRDVTLTVEDDGDNSESLTLTVSVDSADPPSADFGYTPSNPQVGETVSFSEQASDPDGTVQSYEWDFDDDGTAEKTGATVSHSFGSAGEKTIRLTVTDGDGNSATATRNVNVVQNQAPTADAGPDQSVDEDTVVTLDGSGSSDPDGDSISYSWQQTAGPNITLSDADTATPEFVAPSVTGVATLRFEVNVSDGNGGTDTATVDITVNSAGSGPLFGVSATTNSPVTEGDPLELTVDVENTGDKSGSQTLDVDAGALGSKTRTVSLGSGESTTETFTFTTEKGDAGTYTATASSADDSATATVKIEDGQSGDETNLIEGDISNTQSQPISDASDVVLTVTYVGGSGDRTDDRILADGVKLSNLDAGSNNSDITDGVGDAGFLDNGQGEIDKYFINLPSYGAGTQFEITAELAGYATFGGTTSQLSPGDAATQNIRLDPATVDTMFEITDLDPQSGTVNPGDEFAVSATVENTGDGSGEQDVTLRLEPNGAVIATRTVQLDAGTETTVSFTGVSVDSTGTYNHTVASEDDQATGTLVVEEKDLQLYERANGQDQKIRDKIAHNATETVWYILRDSNGERLDDRDVVLTGDGVEADVTAWADSDGLFSIDYGSQASLVSGGTVEFTVEDESGNMVTVESMDVSVDWEKVDLSLSVESDTPVSAGDQLEFVVERDDRPVGEKSTRASLTFYDQSGTAVVTVDTGLITSDEYGVVDTSLLGGGVYEVVAHKPNFQKKTFQNDTATVSITDSNATVQLGDVSAAKGSTTVDLTASGDDVAGYQANVTFDPSVVQFTAATGGDFDSPVVNVDNQNGYVFISQSMSTGQTDPTLATLEFDVVGSANEWTPLQFVDADTMLTDSNSEQLGATIDDGSVSVSETSPLEVDSVTVENEFAGASEASIPDRSLVQGETVTFTATVTNTGSATVSETVTIEFGNTVSKTVSVASLGSGQSTTAYVTVRVGTISPETYSLRASAGGSTTHADVKVVPLGDVDHSGSVDSGDSTVTQQAIVGPVGGTYNPAAADMTVDGSVGPGDVTRIQRTIVGLFDPQDLDLATEFQASGTR